MIPLAAVVTESDGSTGGYVSRESGPTLQPVQLGTTTGTQVQIIDGLDAGEEILIEPPTDKIIEGVDNPF